MLHPDRFFDPDPAVRRAARSLHEETRELPIVSPHGHVDPRILADDAPFPDPASLLVTPDHYVFRMLHSRGLSLESLGIRPRPGPGGAEVETDPRRVWRRFAEHYHLFGGTPTGAWLDYELHEVFGIRGVLSGETADAVYDALEERLASPEFRPRALFERFRIEVLVTTDAATDGLAHHARIRDSGWGGRVLPCFRPDALLSIADRDWPAALAALEEAAGTAVPDLPSFIRALESRRAAFRAMGATATDHGVETPATGRLDADAAAALFRKAVEGSADLADQRRFEAHMLMEMARMSAEDGLVMQLHAGSLRNHDRSLHARFGPDMGADIPVAAEFTRNLRPLLNEYGRAARFRLVLFTLDESTLTRELAPLAGYYPAVRLGPPWWFLDSFEGMTRFRERTTGIAGLYNTAGFNDDTRAFCSIPARHDLARRVDANWLGRLVARHVLDLEAARPLARALAYDLAKETYRL